MTECKHKWRQDKDGSLYCEKCPAKGNMKYVEGFRYVMLENEGKILNFGKFFCGKPTVLLTSGTDKISIPLDCPTLYPEMKYPAYLSIEARRDYGATWLKEMLGVSDFEVINSRQEKIPFSKDKK